MSLLPVFWPAHGISPSQVRSEALFVKVEKIIESSMKTEIEN